MKSLVLAALLGIGTTAFAQNENVEAGVFFEPGITYQAYESKIDWPTPLSDSTGKVLGWGAMGRVGMHLNNIFFVAADARFSRPNFKESSVNYDAGATQWDVGPSVGVQMPWVAGLRAWATYVATSTLDPHAAGNVDVKMSNGKGYRIGAGFRLALVSLNLEYQKVDYDDIKLEKAGPITGTLDSDYAGEGWIASVSFPLAL